MKVLFKRIEKCEDCPYFRTTDEHGRINPYCYKEYKIIETIDLVHNEIPKWCPLPDEEYLYEGEEG